MINNYEKKNNKIFIFYQLKSVNYIIFIKHKDMYFKYNILKYAEDLLKIFFVEYRK